MTDSNDDSEICLAPESVANLRALFENELCHRRAFITGTFHLANRQPCSLVLLHPEGGAFVVTAEAVYLKPEEPGAGVGLELSGLDTARLAELAAFVARPSTSTEAAVSTPTATSTQAVATQTATSTQAVATQAVASTHPSAAIPPRNAHERVRRLSLREREMMAQKGGLSDRIALERAFGSTVWESLLSNPTLSIPEVAHIAKNGTLPVPLVGLIVGNMAWLSAGEIRRALLGNPRVTGAHLERVLRSAPRSELKQIANVSPYRTQVRALAKKLMGE